MLRTGAWIAILAFYNVSMAHFAENLTLRRFGCKEKWTAVFAAVLKCFMGLFRYLV
jgi:hypothetical protein